jgi:hypothetical protein
MRGSYSTKWLAVTALATALFALPSFALACLAATSAGQDSGFHSFQQTAQQHSAPAAPAYHPAPATQAPHQEQQPAQHGHAGDWLRKYKDLSPAEQERALAKDPGFQNLSPAQQDLLRKRLRHFSGLSPQEQIRVLNRMETWEHLTPEQKGEARQLFNQMRKLPPARQRMVLTAIHDLRGMPADQRENVINSPRFRGMFTDHERDMIRGATRLPLAPAEGGENP